MTLTQFEALLDRHGGDLSKWPSAERDDAAELLRIDAAAQTLLTQHQQLAALLDAVPRISASPHLRRAIAEVPLQTQAAPSVLARVVQWLLGGESEQDSASPATTAWGGKLPQAALAAAALSVGIGALSGVALETYDTEPSLDETALAAEGDDLSALAFAEDLDVQW
jgi:hypothetical protein